MDDNYIIELFFARDEDAIHTAQQQYGAYCTAIAQNILSDPGAAEECVNDMWLQCWQAIPPQRPRSLKSFAGRIVRNLALNVRRTDAAWKRGGVVSGEDTPEEALDRTVLLEALNRFLAELPEVQRNLFLRRYWYLDSVEQMAKRFAMSKTQVTTTLHRLRVKLRAYLEQEGFEL